MCHCNEHKLLPVSKDRAVDNCKNIQQRVETEESWNALSATPAQFTTAKIQGCANVSSNSSRSEGVRLGWRTPRVDSLKLVNYTQIENAHKVCKKFLYFNMWLLYVQLLRRKNRYRLVWAIMINQPELPTNDEARNEGHIASRDVRLY